MPTEAILAPVIVDRRAGAAAPEAASYSEDLEDSGAVESPMAALLRRLLFPISATLALFASAVALGQPITGPYFALAALAFVLCWQSPGNVPLHSGLLHWQSESLLSRVVLAWTKVVGFLLLVGFVAKISATYSRAVVVLWVVATPILFAALHLLARRGLRRWYTCGCVARTHVIVGRGAASRQLAARIDIDPAIGRFIGFFDAKKDEETLGDIDALPDYVRRNAIDAVYIAWSPELLPGLNRLLEDLRDTTASIYFFFDCPSHGHCAPRIVNLCGTPLLAYFETPHSGLRGAAKRAMDVVLSAALLVLLSPLMLAIALSIRIESPGPALFRQRRYGRNGEVIAVYKFRTMSVLEDGDHIVQARRDDARVTRIGRFLRRTSLDELPQLFCVLIGSMSLVGPRPHAIAHNERYRRLISGYMSRHIVRPGITGWAQVNGLRGETRTLEQMRARIAFDLEYLRRWSPWTDLKILLRTALLVARDRNAY